MDPTSGDNIRRIPQAEKEELPGSSEKVAEPSLSGLQMLVQMEHLQTQEAKSLVDGGVKCRTLKCFHFQINKSHVLITELSWWRGDFHLSAPSSYSVLIAAFGHMNMQLSAHQTSPVQNLSGSKTALDPHSGWNCSLHCGRYK